MLEAAICPVCAELEVSCPPLRVNRSTRDENDQIEMHCVCKRACLLVVKAAPGKAIEVWLKG